METLQAFSALGLSENLLKALKEKGFETPSPIQEKAIPIILNQKCDLVGHAQTGTGKTAAFGLPLIDLIAERSKRVQVIILAPTRELAIQISEEMNSFKGSKKIHIVPIYGGQSIEVQYRKLASGVDIVVGTPGRVLDLLQRKALNLEAIDYLVFDEADEMLKLGFQDEIEKILKQTNPEKRTFMFCATMPDEVMTIARNFMGEFETIKIKSQQMTTDLTDQIYFEVEDYDKFEALCRIIDFEIDFYGLIFCKTKVEVDNVTGRLMDRGYEVDSIHGDISQAQREKVLTKFRNKRVNILIATDVAARGIDVQNLTHVINYSLPQDAESYVHRIGRTGRAGNEGTAITFVTRRESRNLMFIQRKSKTEIRKGKIPGVTEIINQKKKWIKTQLNSFVFEEIEKVFKSLAKDIIAENDPIDVLAAALKFTFSDELDAATYKEIKDNRPSRDYDRDSRDGRGSRDGRSGRDGGRDRGGDRGDFRDREFKQNFRDQTKLLIAMGKKDGMTKKSIVDLIKEKAKTHDRKINDVQVFDNHSFITVPFQEAEFILRVFRKEKGNRSIVEKVDERQK